MHDPARRSGEAEPVEDNGEEENEDETANAQEEARSEPPPPPKTTSSKRCASSLSLTYDLDELWWLIFSGCQEDGLAQANGRRGRGSRWRTRTRRYWNAAAKQLRLAWHGIRKLLRRWSLSHTATPCNHDEHRLLRWYACANPIEKSTKKEEECCSRHSFNHCAQP